MTEDFRTFRLPGGPKNCSDESRRACLAECQLSDLLSGEVLPSEILG